MLFFPAKLTTAGVKRSPPGRASSQTGSVRTIIGEVLTPAQARVNPLISFFSPGAKTSYLVLFSCPMMPSSWFKKLIISKAELQDEEMSLVSDFQ